LIQIFGIPARALRRKGSLPAALIALSSFLAPFSLAKEFPFLVTTEPSRQLVETGRRQLIDFRLGEAEVTFRTLYARSDGAVAAYHHLAAASLFKALMTDRPVYYEEFFERADSMLQFLKQAPEGEWRTYLEAENHLQRAVVLAKQERLIRAALAARTAYLKSAQAIREYPEFYEPYKGMGLLHLAIGSLPATYRNLLSFLGFPGEIEQGLQDLRVAAERSTYSREEGLLGLALADALLYSAPEQAESRLHTLYEQNAESPMIAFFYGFMLLKNRKASTAERVLARAAAKGRQQGYFYIDYVDYFLADALFRQSRFAEAEPYYRRYLSRHSGPALKAPAYLALGVALEMQGKREEAVQIYQQVESTRGFDDDAVAVREAERRLEHPITPTGRRLLLGASAFDAGQYETAETILHEVWNSGSATADERAETAYRLGRLYQVQRQWNEALHFFTVCTEVKGDPLARWAPWSRYYIGQIYAGQGNKEAARMAYEQALRYQGKFNYYQSLEQSARAGLKRLD
jgi:tetratricopeptide (TPR) repeat protein